MDAHEIDTYRALYATDWKDPPDAARRRSIAAIANPSRQSDQSAERCPMPTPPSNTHAIASSSTEDGGLRFVILKKHAHAKPEVVAWMTLPREHARAFLADCQRKLTGH